MRGFALGFDSWGLWNYVGQRTRKAWDLDELGRWRKPLAKRYPRIESFHKELEYHFYRDVGGSYTPHRELDAKAHRLFIDEIVHDGLQQVSFVVALALSDTLPVVGRWQSWFLCEAERASESLPEKIRERLQTAFPGSMFHVAIAEDITNDPAL
ncbi:MAG: hypothetical protein DME50_10645 [Verrucomicrobia bacterium]|nr:MAG: hypothetical protein DME50_10645 [Verrucomicrobiota bacterium]